MKLKLSTLGSVAITGAALAIFALVALPGSSGAANADPPAVPTATILKHEKAIAACMQSAGFEYTAVLPKDVRQETALQKALAEGGDPGAALKASKDTTATPDANERYVGSLTPDRRAAYALALWGTDTTPGCAENTFEQAWGISPQDLTEVGNRHLAQVEGDSRVKKAADAYVRCMSSAGYEVADVDDIYELVGLKTEKMTYADGAAIREPAYAAHQTCLKPYSNTKNLVDREKSGT